MGIEALRTAVEEEARARIAGILEEARLRAAAIRGEAVSEVAARRDRKLREEEAALRDDAAQRIAAARSAARRRVLEARQALLDRVFALAGDELPAVLEGPNAHERMVELAEEALCHMPPGPVRITCSVEISDPLEQAFAGRDDVRIERDPGLGAGLRAIGGGGAIVVDATLEKLLELRRPRLAIEVLERLEGREGA